MLLTAAFLLYVHSDRPVGGAHSCSFLCPGGRLEEDAALPEGTPALREATCLCLVVVTELGGPAHFARWAFFLAALSHRRSGLLLSNKTDFFSMSL